MATQEGRISALEQWQKSHEDSEREWRMQHQETNQKSIESLTSLFSLRFEAVEGIAQEAVIMARQTNIDMVTLPDRIIKAIKEEAITNKAHKTPWDMFKAKMIESLATLIAGGIVAGVGYIIVQV